MKTKNFFRRMVSTLAALIISIFIMPAVKQEEARADFLSNGQKIAAVARTYVGIFGMPNKITDYWQGLETDWCAMMLAPISDEAGFTRCFPRSTYVDRSDRPESERVLNPGFRDWFEEQGRFAYRDTYKPKVGDLIVYHYMHNGHYRDLGDHIGIIVDYDPITGLITSVEGNVNNSSCICTHYDNDPTILGYCRPAYNDYSGENLIDDGSNTPGEAPADAPAVPEETPSVTVPETPEEVPAVTVPDTPVMEGYSCYQNKSPIGGWLHEDCTYGAKIGIVSTDVYVYSDKRFFDWVHIVSVQTENGYYGDGWMHLSNLKAAPEEAVTEETTEAPAVNEPVYNEPVYNEPVYEAPVEMPQTPAYGEEYYVSCQIGGNGRYSPDFSDNIICIVDTDSRLYVTDWVNGFAYCKVEATGQWLYIHSSTIKPVSEAGCYTPGTIPTHTVNEAIGCNMRAWGSYDAEVIAILDYGQAVTVLTAANELGYAYCEVTLPNGTVLNGYISMSVLS